ncbi:red chlorophyll catabolite reductase [[Phormidium ambiguum] IAM M-71]|uniref:Red chlorophyll catabolite reductase n=1 Tax=[Phormidium ambiguum] IAM M-71 TaxID=454136 RepID=A0A1U7IJL7_9CYAN|nr:red chlorophyll catabolite reductase [Phormidium ambiguum]OKH37309.1 red chlorophyll catabolite reductase [Phormidium ambiguum IAM M-71]
MVNPQPNLDNAVVFEQLWQITHELRQKIEARFTLHPEPSTKDLEEYTGIDSNVKGSMKTFSGSEIDWLVHSLLHNSKTGFSTMRLTTWLKPHISVPHLAFEFSSFGNILFYIDYVPRNDLLMNLDDLNRYYEPVNQTFLTLQSDSRLSPFISKSLQVRVFQSPISLCYTCSPTEDLLTLIRTISHEMVDRWLGWIDVAEAVPESMRKLLSERDLFIRRYSAESDPGNKKAEQILGNELTNKLVKALWGGDRFLT